MKPRKLYLSAVALDIKDADPKANLAALEQFIKILPAKTDLIVVPELFGTGFVTDRALAESLAEPVDGYTMTAIRELADVYRVAIAGSYLANDGGKLYNRAFFVEPDGSATFYDKHHLFCISREAEYVSQGDKPIPVVRYRGWNIALCVCYDTRFPVWLRNDSLKYDLLVVPANWPDKRSYAWEHLLIARAIENQAYVCGANRSGEDIFGSYDNHSHIFDYTGKPISEAEGDGKVLNAVIEKDSLEVYRAKFPVWRDADAFTIE